MSVKILSLHILFSVHLSLLFCPRSIYGAHIEVRAEGTNKTDHFRADLSNECKTGKEEFDKATPLLNFVKKEMENGLFATKEKILTDEKNETESVEQLRKYLQSLKYTANVTMQLNETLIRKCDLSTKETFTTKDDGSREARMRFRRALLHRRPEVELKGTEPPGVNDDVLKEPIKPRLWEDCDVCESMTDFLSELFAHHPVSME